ncbi:MAG: molybdate ABC transporter substrate-binding protein [Bacillota bacterium]
MRIWLPWLLLGVGVLLAGCSAGPERAAPRELVVSAAASLGDALEEARTAFQGREQGLVIRLNLGSSGALSRQIQQGAPADLFLSAADAPMEALVQAGLVERRAVANLASNQIVLIRSRAVERVRGWADLPRAGRIALGNPQHVPAGQYGRAVLESLGLWGAVEPRLVFGEDVRQVLQFVASGEVDAGLVYRSDAASSPQVVVVAEAPAGSHPPVGYPMAVLKESRLAADARRFADFLRSAQGQQIFARHGFAAPQ